MANSTDKQVSTLTDNEVDTILASAAKIYQIVKGDGFSLDKEPKALDSFDAENVDLDVLSGTFVRAFKALESKVKRARHAQNEEIKVKVNALLKDAREQGMKARAAFEAMDPALRSAMGAVCPDSIAVPLSSLTSAFPTGATEPQIVKILHSLSFELIKGKQGPQGPKVKVALVEKAPLAPPARQAAGNE